MLTETPFNLNYIISQKWIEIQSRRLCGNCYCLLFENCLHECILRKSEASLFMHFCLSLKNIIEKDKKYVNKDSLKVLFSLNWIWIAEPSFNDK